MTESSSRLLASEILLVAASPPQRTETSTKRPRSPIGRWSPANRVPPAAAVSGSVALDPNLNPPARDTRRPTAADSGHVSFFNPAPVSR